ncbi:MAG: prepilin-type N-terminal cleavage/methylation domain-containing protein [Syntrophomonadaceae bacterium]|nr:prepilin-type N-terminal cleavage/methylation domain-containing protein [Syntrophomonadaceae bacterium]
MSGSKRNDLGFTLVEVLVASVILALVLGGAYSMLQSGAVSYKIGEAKIDVQQNVRVAVAEVAREVRSSRQALEMQVVINSVLYSSANPGNIFLSKPDGSVVLYYWHFPAGSPVAERELRRAVRNPGVTTFSGFNPVAYGITGVHFAYDRVPLTASRVVTIKIQGADHEGRTYELETKSSFRLPAGS